MKGAYWCPAGCGKCVTYYKQVLEKERRYSLYVCKRCETEFLCDNKLRETEKNIDPLLKTVKTRKHVRKI